MEDRPSTKRPGIRAVALIAAGLIAGAVLAGTLSAGAQTVAPSTTAPAVAPNHPGNGETALTGATADKVKAAALAAVPGATVDRVESDADGSPYEAHITKADGTRWTVKVDKDFKVTSVQPGCRSHAGAGPSSTTTTSGTSA